MARADTARLPHATDPALHPEHPSDPEPRLLPLPGGALACTDEGAGERVVVAIAGLPGTVRDFRWLAPALSPQVRFVRLDLPGFGASPRAAVTPLSLAQRAEAVVRLLDGLDLPRATLLGHSSGGMVAAHVARHHPERVEALALVACPGPTAHYPVAAFRRFGLLLQHAPARRALAPLQRRLYRAMGFPRSVPEAELTSTTLDAGAQDFALHRDNVAHLSCPTLVAWALDDPLIPADKAEALAALAPPGPRLRFTEGGHNLQKSKAIELAEAVITGLG